MLVRQFLMCMTGQCLLHLTVVMARAFQTEIPQNALQPKQSRVLCDMLYFRNNSSSGLTAALLLIYSAGLLELQTNTHTHNQAELNRTNVNLDQWAAQKQSCTLLLTVQTPVNRLQTHRTMDKYLGYCCSDFYRARLTVASGPFEPLTHFFMDIKR